MSAVIPAGWGFRPQARTTRERFDYRRAKQSLRHADPALLDVPCGVLARDLAAVLGIAYQAAFGAVRFVKFHRGCGH